MIPSVKEISDIIFQHIRADDPVTPAAKRIHALIEDRMLNPVSSKEYRVGRRKETVILDGSGSVVCEFSYNKKEGEAQKLAIEYVNFKNGQS